MQFAIGAALENSGYYVVDLETTGINSAFDKIVEIAVVHVSEQGVIDSKWTTLINPLGSVGPTHVHAITQDMVEDAPTFEQVAPFLYDMIAGVPLVAHNASFDVGFLTEAFHQVGIHIFGNPLPYIDTIELAKKHMNLPNYRLATCCEHAGIELNNAHTALADTQATAELFIYLMKKQKGEEFPQMLEAQNMTWEIPDEIVAPTIKPRMFS